MLQDHAKTSKQKTDTVLFALNPNRKPARHVPEEREDDKLCHLHLKTIYAIF